MNRTVAATPHSRSKADKRVGQSAPVGDPWAARIRDAILDDAHPAQGDAMLDPSRRITMLTGRGAGKTSTYKGKYLIEMTATTKGKFIYACPTLGMAVELLWEPLKQACEQLGIMDDCEWKEAPREGGKILTIKRTGSRLKLFGADDKKQINLCRGQPFDGVGCDEVAFWPSVSLVNNFVEDVIEPRIGERDGWIGLASTPGHELRGLFYDATRDNSADHRPYNKRDQFPDWTPEQWSSHAWSLRDVVEIKDAARRYPSLVALRSSHLRIKIAKGWRDDHPKWMREYEGRWSANNTTMVFQFDATKNLWSPQRFDPQTKTWRDGALPTVEGIQLLKIALAALPQGFEWHFVLGGDKGSPRVANENADGDKKREGDPYAFNVFAFAPADPEKRLFHVFFHERTGMYARPIAQLMLGADEKGANGCMPHEKPGGLLGVLGWPDGMVLDADAALISELANVYGLRFEKAEKRPDYKAGAIELTNGDLTGGNIRVIENSPLHTQITGLQWAEQESGALKEDPSQANHSTDTLIYSRMLVSKMYESGVVTKESSSDRESVGYVDPMGLGTESESADGIDGLFDSWHNGQTDDGWEIT